MAAVAWGRTGLIALLALIPVVVQGLLYKDTLLDDPFITFRYADHLVQGHGLVWNPGEKPVEGFTSFGWTMLSALGIRLGVHPLAFAKGLGMAALVAMVLLPLTRLNTVTRTWLGKGLVAALIGLCPLLSFYAMSGMEQNLFACLVLASTLAYMRGLDQGDRRFTFAAALIAGVSGLVRPEGLGVFGIMALFEAFRAWRSGDRPERALRDLAAFTAGFAVVWLPFFLWRFGYFGYPFPNTYYAKHTGGGLAQVANGLLYYLAGLNIYLLAPLGFVFGAGLAATGRAGPPARPGTDVAFMIWFLLAYSGYIVLVGGDDTSAFPSVRFFVPMIPIVYLLVARMLEPLRARALAAALLTALVVAGATPDVLRFVAANGPALRFDQGLVAGLRALATPRGSSYEAPALATWIRARTAPDETIAVPWAGAVAYYSERRVIDTLGLNDEHIAHLPKRQRGIDVKMDPAYVIGRRPRLIFVNVARDVALGKLGFEAGGGWKLGDKEMIALLQRHPDYRLVMDAPTSIIVYERVTPR
jgi:hypothetical protein